MIRDIMYASSSKYHPSYHIILCLFGGDTLECSTNSSQTDARVHLRSTRTWNENRRCFRSRISRCTQYLSSFNICCSLVFVSTSDALPRCSENSILVLHEVPPKDIYKCLQYSQLHVGLYHLVLFSVIVVSQTRICRRFDSFSIICAITYKYSLVASDRVQALNPDHTGMSRGLNNAIRLAVARKRPLDSLHC
jgi:hypothetical protein